MIPKTPLRISPEGAEHGTVTPRCQRWAGWVTDLPTMSLMLGHNTTDGGTIPIPHENKMKQCLKWRWGIKINICRNQNVDFSPLDCVLPSSVWNFHTKFCLPAHLWCCSHPLQSHRVTATSGCEETVSVKLLPRTTEKKEEGRKQEKILCGLWKRGDWAAQQITPSQLGMESEKHLWNKKEPVRKEQASSVRGN